LSIKNPIINKQLQNQPIQTRK